MKKRQEETYTITPKGLLSLSTSTNPGEIWDDLELYCYRHGFNAIKMDKNGGQFIHMEDWK